MKDPQHGDDTQAPRSISDMVRSELRWKNAALTYKAQRDALQEELDRLREAGKRLVFTKPERAIFEALSSTTPTLFSDIRVSLHERVKDRALQRLRKRGFVKYLKKSEGGPGWVTNLQPTSKPDDVKRVY